MILKMSIGGRDSVVADAMLVVWEEEKSNDDCIHIASLKRLSYFKISLFYVDLNEFVSF